MIVFSSSAIDSAPDGFVLKTREELVWSPTSPGKTHYLDFGPSHRYNPELKASKGAWEPASNQKGRDACSDIFYLQQRTEGPSWKYMGTYQCIGERLCRMKEIEDVMNTVRTHPSHHRYHACTVTEPILIFSMSMDPSARGQCLPKK